MTIIKYLLLSFPLICWGQESSGLHFEAGFTWNQILQKAKAENKDIFVDCYATWCGPCKLMDANVYPDPAVGNYMNDKFIAVKVQMDKTKEDDSAVKKWYGTALILGNTYAISAYPSFLYFSSDGKPLHKHVGGGSASDFISWAKEAQDPEKQYYAILKNFQPGKLDTADEKGLAEAYRFTDKDLAGKMLVDYLDHGGWKTLEKNKDVHIINEFSASPNVKNWVEQKLENLNTNDLNKKIYCDLLIGFRTDSIISNKALSFIDQIKEKSLSEPEYLELLSAYSKSPSVQLKVRHYLDELPEKELLKRDNINLGYRVCFSTIEPKDKLFNLFYENGEAVKKSIGDKSLSERVVDGVINNKIVYPVLIRVPNALDVTEPDWLDLHEQIQKVTDKNCADRNTIKAQVTFFGIMVKRAEAAKSQDKFKWGTKLSTALIASRSDESVAQTGSDLGSVAGLNNDAWTIFQYSNNQLELKKALMWAEKVVSLDSKSSTYIDTYANLEYKLGKQQEALELEEKALSLTPRNKTFEETLNKMKNNVPTWETNK